MDYKDIFRPDTIERLNRQSAENLKKMVGDKSLMQTLRSSGQLLQEVMEIEKPYIPQLEELAIQMVEDLYPIIGEENINIDAKIVSMGDVNASLDEIKVNKPTLLSKLLKVDEDGESYINSDLIHNILLKYFPNDEYNISSYIEDMDIYDLNTYSDITLQNLIKDYKLFLKYVEEDED
jgi:hypothetical protein